MRILVTGASGFVGPHLCQALQQFDHDIWTTDRAAAPQSTKHSICDLMDATAVRALVATIAPQAIVHLASMASVGDSFHEPQKTLSNNVTAACNILEAVRHEVPTARLLMIGSAEQYGIVDAAELPLSEEQPQRPASPYAVAKVSQEVLALQYHRSWKLDVVLTRSFNHSGPGQTNRFVLPAFAEQIAQCERGQHDSVLQVGNLEAQRDFLDVRDVARAYVALLDKGMAGTAYNVCRGQTFRISELVQGLLQRSRVPMRLQPDPSRMRPSDLPVLQGSAQRLRHDTGWQPTIDMQQTLDDILADWRQRVASVAAVDRAGDDPAAGHGRS
jgi:GDP-4-dehydro-6-deoxy-D-mannose reductase